MESLEKRMAAFEVLLVEDSPGDVRLTREAFKDAKVHINLHVASDGQEALAFLRREGKNADVPLPDLILLSKKQHVLMNSFLHRQPLSLRTIGPIADQ